MEPTTLPANPAATAPAVTYETAATARRVVVTPGPNGIGRITWADGTPLASTPPPPPPPPPAPADPDPAAVARLLDVLRADAAAKRALAAAHAKRTLIERREKRANPAPEAAPAPPPGAAVLRELAAAAGVSQREIGLLAGISRGVVAYTLTRDDRRYHTARYQVAAVLHGLAARERTAATEAA